MSLIERLEDELKQAMAARDADRRDTLRLILASLRSAEKELQRPLHDDEELQVLQRERKRRTEAAEAFRAGDREEQAEDEERELAVLEEFMPEPLTEDELEEIVDDAIAEVGATSMRDIGRVMADVMPQVAGRADGSGRLPVVQARPTSSPLRAYRGAARVSVPIVWRKRHTRAVSPGRGRRAASAYTERACRKFSRSPTTSPPSSRPSATAFSTRCVTGFESRSCFVATG
jgi:uncharacterized protein